MLRCRQLLVQQRTRLNNPTNPSVPMTRRERGSSKFILSGPNDQLSDTGSTLDASGTAGPSWGCQTATSPPVQGHVCILRRPPSPSSQGTRPTSPSPPRHASMNLAPASTPLRNAALRLVAGHTAMFPPTHCCSELVDLGRLPPRGYQATLLGPPHPRRKQRRQPLNFSLRCRRSATTAKAKTTAPPTAERRAQVQILCTLGIIKVDHVITAKERKAYDGLFRIAHPHCRPCGNRNACRS